MKIYPKNLNSLKKNQSVHFDNKKKLELNVSCSWMSTSIKRVTDIKKTQTKIFSAIFVVVTKCHSFVLHVRVH